MDKLELVKEVCLGYADKYIDEYLVEGSSTYELAVDILDIIERGDKVINYE